MHCRKLHKVPVSVSEDNLNMCAPVVVIISHSALEPRPYKPHMILVSRGGLEISR